MTGPGVQRLAGADKLWEQGAWSFGWMDPPWAAARAVVSPVTQRTDRGGHSGDGADGNGFACFRWKVGRRWAWYRWRLRDGRWLHAKVAVNPFDFGRTAGDRALFAVCEGDGGRDDKPLPRRPGEKARAWPVGLLPAELLRMPEARPRAAPPPERQPELPLAPRKEPRRRRAA